MSKRPTPKKRQSNDRSGNRYGSFLRKERKRILGQVNSPFGKYMEKEASTKALEKITKIKA